MTAANKPMADDQRIRKMVNACIDPKRGTMVGFAYEAVYELAAELDHYKQYGHNLVAEKKRWENGAELLIKLEAHFRAVETELRSELARLTKREGEWREAMPRCSWSGCTKLGTKYILGKTLNCDKHGASYLLDAPWAPLVRTNRGHVIRLCSNVCWLIYSPLVGAWALFLNHGTFAAINVLGFYRWRRIERQRASEERWFEEQRRSA